MNITDVQERIQKLTNSKITQSEIAHALNKDRSNINAKAKRGTDLKLSEVRQLENYFNIKLIQPEQQQNNNTNIINDYATTILTVEEYIDNNKIDISAKDRALVLALVLKCVDKIVNSRQE